MSIKEKSEKAKALRALVLLVALLPLVSSLLSCAVSSAALLEDGGVQPDAKSEREEGLPPLHLTFLGDIMAHTENQETPDYSWIYSDIAPFLLGDDLTFANFETPVSPSLPMSTYPAFNAHPPYLEAAVDAGCDVFSIANNHINDHGRAALLETLDEFSALLDEGRIAGFSGLRRIGDEPMQPILIEKKGWKILYLAATEILNDYSKALDLIYYTPSTKNGREAFKRALSQMRAENPCDLFVLSLHTDEPEYVIEASEAKRAYFRELATECGVDIIWAHHPHVNQPWELIPRGEGERSAFAIYSSGNFISGQRRQLNTANPAAAREYTGDAFIFRVVVTEKLLSPIPVLVLSYRNLTAPRESREHYFTVRHFNRRFIENLNKDECDYYQARFTLMRQFLQE